MQDWRKIIQGRFGELDGRCCSLNVREAFRLDLWKDTRRGQEEFGCGTSIWVKHGLRTNLV